MQSQSFLPSGRRVPVTHILAGPCPVIQVKTKEKDGYQGVQLGFGTRKIKNLKKPILGHFKKAGQEKNPPRFLREIREDGEIKDEKEEAGKIIKVDEVFKVGDKATVTGISKGKGFAGVVKRFGFAGGPRTHGQSDRERAPGSIGQTTTPGRVYKGKRMAGRMGGKRVTVKGLEVIEVRKEENLLVVKGLVPGTKKTLLIIRNENSHD